MDKIEIERELIKVLQEIQKESGYEYEFISGETCPVCDLKGFDSKIRPVAITMLGAATQISIPKGDDIFKSENESHNLTVSEIADALSKKCP